MNIEKEMTVSEYAEIRKVSNVAVTRAMNKGKKLVGVLAYKKVRRDWILTVLTKDVQKNPKRYLVIPK